MSEITASVLKRASLAMGGDIFLEDFQRERSVLEKEFIERACSIVRELPLETLLPLVEALDGLRDNGAYYGPGEFLFHVLSAWQEHTLANVNSDLHDHEGFYWNFYEGAVTSLNNALLAFEKKKKEPLKMVPDETAIDQKEAA